MRQHLVFTLAFYTAILLLVGCLKFFPIHVVGISMLPTIESNQMAVAERYWFWQQPQRGDVIMFVAPPEPTRYYVKRIIGLPGDVISIDGSTVTLDGVTLAEPYVSPALQGTPNTFRLFAIIPSDSYFVEGDDRKWSYDSRAWGFVPRSSIVGRLVYLYNSPDNTRFLPNESWVYAGVHQTGVFQTSGTSGNAALLLFMASPSMTYLYGVLLRRLPRKKKQHKKAVIRQPTPYGKYLRSPWYRLGSLVPPVVVMLLFCSCSIIPSIGHRTPAPIEQPLSAPFQPFRSVQLCLDTPPLYPARYTREAAAAIADRIDSAVTVNQGGLQVYVSYITSNSFQNAAVELSVPAFPADPAAPLPPKVGDDPYQNAATGQAYQKAFAVWQETLVTQHHTLALLRAQVKKWTDTLRALPAPYDNTGADPWGCLDDAAQHVMGVTGEKYLLIASPLLSTTTLQKLDTLSLEGATVKIIWHTCMPEVASTCQANDAKWKDLFLHFGARSVTFFDVPQSQVALPTF